MGLGKGFFETTETKETKETTAKQSNIIMIIDFSALSAVSAVSAVSVVPAVPVVSVVSVVTLIAKFAFCFNPTAPLCVNWGCLVNWVCWGLYPDPRNPYTTHPPPHHKALNKSLANRALPPLKRYLLIPKKSSVCYSILKIISYLCIYGL